MLITLEAEGDAVFADPDDFGERLFTDGAKSEGGVRSETGVGAGAGAGGRGGAVPKIAAGIRTLSI